MLNNNGLPGLILLSPMLIAMVMGVYSLAKVPNSDDKFNYAIESNLPKQGKPVQSQSADQHIQQKKNNAIGRSSTNKSGNTISFKSQDHNLVTSKLSRCRSSGCVPPPKIAASRSNTSKCC